MPSSAVKTPNEKCINSNANWKRRDSSSSSSKICSNLLKLNNMIEFQHPVEEA